MEKNFRTLGEKMDQDQKINCRICNKKIPLNKAVLNKYTKQISCEECKDKLQQGSLNERKVISIEKKKTQISNLDLNKPKTFNQDNSRLNSNIKSKNSSLNNLNSKQVSKPIADSFNSKINSSEKQKISCHFCGYKFYRKIDSISSSCPYCNKKLTN